MTVRVAAMVVGLALGITSTAFAQSPPANDNRAAARVIVPPTSVHGTTVGSTREATEPGSSCGQEDGSVWYQFTARESSRIVASLHAAGDLDAIVDVFRRVRSQSEFLDCDATDAQGDASVTFRVKAGDTYLIRVSQLPNSVSGTFDLSVLIALSPATPPGKPLPRGGVSQTLDRTFNISDAWSVRMRAGHTYRINAVLKGRGCMRFALYPPGTTDFDSDQPVRTASCGGYTLFTPGPGESGRYSILVQADRRQRGIQRYHLQVAPARRDDTAPGIFIRNYAHVRGSLNGSRIDVVDLYRFDVTRPSSLKLTLDTDVEGFEMVLLDDAGHQISSAEGAGDIDRHVGRGRYFVAVRALRGASGTYVLRRISRTITRSRIDIDGRRHAKAPPGATVVLAVHISPSVSGPVTIDVERFDPLEGWQFFRRYHLRAHGGVASVGFRPPAVGRWSASGSFLGTRSASPSSTGHASLLVAGPLQQ